MSNFDRALALILKSEGGYSNDPRDPGGETYKGIARNRNPHWQGWAKVDADKGAGFPANLESDSVLQGMVMALYLDEYWNACQCSSLNDKLGLLVFDCAVNQGSVTAAKLLQAAVGAVQDGVIGQKTLDAANRNPEAAALFMAERTLRYTRTANFYTYGKGWLKRLFITAMEA